MDDLSINTPMGFEEEDNREKNTCCPLCEYADDAGSALGYLKQMDTALGGRTSDGQLGPMMEESYNTFFAEPMRSRDVMVPELSAEQILLHFTEHDINPLRLLRKDINRLNQIQETLRPRASSMSGGLVCNEAEAKHWAHLQRLKMDLLRQYEQTDARTDRTMPVVPTI